MRLRVSVVSLCFIVFLLSPWVAVAKTSSVSAMVKLNRIEAEKTTEQGGDEIYFNVTSYSSSGQSTMERTPQAPAHWNSKALDKVKDIILWEGNLDEGEEVKLILSVVEQEFPIWEHDELIGGAQLELKNQKGTLKPLWVVPQFEEQVDVEMKSLPQDKANAKNSAVFLLKGAGAVYEVAFSVEQK